VSGYSGCRVFRVSLARWVAHLSGFAWLVQPATGAFVAAPALYAVGFLRWRWLATNGSNVVVSCLAPVMSCSGVGGRGHHGAQPMRSAAVQCLVRPPAQLTACVSDVWLCMCLGVRVLCLCAGVPGAHVLGFTGACKSHSMRVHQPVVCVHSRQGKGWGYGLHRLFVSRRLGSCSDCMTACGWRVVHVGLI
jgi:hypothetical protein